MNDNKRHWPKTLGMAAAIGAAGVVSGCVAVPVSDPYYASPAPAYGYYPHPAQPYYYGHRPYYRGRGGDFPGDRDNNPPGPRGGPGTNWENPPGPRGGPGASPDRRWYY